ncbi:MAG: valine--tRNA ligase [Rhodobacteraceae bacterium]|nr:valine--tRNA ligase [Paracoccaceae bacterium]
MAMEKNFDSAEAEQRIYAAWEAAGAFKAGANAKEGMDTFTIMIPPPNVTGVLHMGHAFNNTLQDILIRWKRMQGYDTLWQPGQDHAGIATQMVVERQLAEQGLPGRKELGREKFLEKVWEWKEQSGGTIMEQTKRLGASCDWSRNRFTMSGAPGAPDSNEGDFHSAVLKVFVEMYNHKDKDGNPDSLIYKGTRLVNWDPKFETAISDLEVENTEVDGHMWHFKYPLAGGATYEYIERDEDGVETLRETRNYIAIATTRPETMLGDGAVAVHPDDERYKPLIGKLCEIPVGPKEHRRLIPIITDEYPDMNFGSGAVKITGAHDQNDYEVATRNNIPLYRLMDTKASMRDDGTDYVAAATRAKAISEGADFESAEIDALNLVPDAYRGMDRYVCRKAVIADIDAEGLMLEVEAKKIMQPFGDRSKVVVEPMLTQQWYVDTAKIVKPALDAVRSGDIKIIPESGEKTYYHWLENIEPWCISRQLWWGHQIPVWYGPEVDKDGVIISGAVRAFCAATETEVLTQAEDYYGDQVTVQLEHEQDDEGGALKDFIPPSAMGVGPDGKLDWTVLDRDPDVLDTWFSSGLWPIGTLGWPDDTAEMDKYFPTSVLITGFDIIFFWVARMIMMQLAVVDEIPFHTVYLHALVRDEQGKKMSKSTGNVIDPLEMIDEFGADAVRFTLSAMGRDLKLSKERFIGYRNFGTKLWNATRFAEMNECKPGNFDPASATQTVNKWIIGETVRALHATDKAFEAYRFSDAAMGLYAHVWGKFCDWYVEFAKPLFQSDDEAVKAETRATMAWAIDQSLTMLHPIMPYITEQLWGDIAERKNMLVHQDWPKLPESLIDDDANREMTWVISLIENIRSVRAEMRVPAGAKVEMLYDIGNASGDEQIDVLQIMGRNSILIQRLARVNFRAEIMDEIPKGSVTVPMEGGTFCLPLADIIDVAAEKARLDKAMLKLSKEIGGLKGKLSNEKFLARAPEIVVTENRENLARVESEAAKIKEAIKRLEALG